MFDPNAMTSTEQRLKENLEKTTPTKLESYKTAVISTHHLSSGDMKILTLAADGSNLISERQFGFFVVLPDDINELIEEINATSSNKGLVKSAETSTQLFYIIKTLRKSGYKLVDFDAHGTVYGQLEKLS